MKKEKILEIYDDYLQACDKCPNSAAFYLSRGGGISARSILLGETSLDDVLSKISKSDTLFSYGYDKYLSKETKNLVTDYKIRQLKKQIVK